MPANPKQDIFFFCILLLWRLCQKHLFICVDTYKYNKYILYGRSWTRRRWKKKKSVSGYNSVQCLMMVMAIKLITEIWFYWYSITNIYFSIKIHNAFWVCVNCKRCIRYVVVKGWLEESNEQMKKEWKKKIYIKYRKDSAQQHITCVTTNGWIYQFQPNE